MRREVLKVKGEGGGKTFLQRMKGKNYDTIIVRKGPEEQNASFSSECVKQKMGRKKNKKQRPQPVCKRKHFVRQIGDEFTAMLHSVTRRLITTFFISTPSHAEGSENELKNWRRNACTCT